MARLRPFLKSFLGNVRIACQVLAEDLMWFESYYLRGFALFE